MMNIAELAKIHYLSSEEQARMAARSETFVPRPRQGDSDENPIAIGGTSSTANSPIELATPTPPKLAAAEAEVSTPSGTAATEEEKEPTPSPLKKRALSFGFHDVESDEQFDERIINLQEDSACLAQELAHAHKEKERLADTIVQKQHALGEQRLAIATLTSDLETSRAQVATAEKNKQSDARIKKELSDQVFNLTQELATLTENHKSKEAQLAKAETTNYLIQQAADEKMTGFLMKNQGNPIAQRDIKLDAPYMNANTNALLQAAGVKFDKERKVAFGLLPKGKAVKPVAYWLAAEEWS